MATNLPGNVDTDDLPLDDSTPRNSEENDEMINIQFHGSCPKCCHLHTNHSFRFPSDLTKHTRFRCEECCHQIFGIGRSSTQTTLASVESIPPSRRNSANTRLPSLHVCVNEPLPPPDLQASSPGSPEHINATGHLTPIAEINTVGGRSRSASLQGPSSTSPARESIPTDDTSRVADNLTRRTNGGQQARSTTSRIKAVLNRLRPKKRSSGGTTEIKILGYQISLTRVSREPRRISPYSSQEVRDPSPLSLAVQPTEDPGILGGRQVPRNSTPERQIPTPPPIDRPHQNEIHETTEREPDTQLPHPPIGSANTSGPITDDSSTEAKRNRIKAHRREKTLKSEAKRRPVCNCHTGCPCLGDGRVSGHGRVSEDSSGNHRDWPVVPQALGSFSLGGHPSSGISGSQHSQAPPNPIHFAGIGHHLDGSRRTSTTEESSSTTASQIHLNRLSITTTMYGSNDSTISLPPGRTLGGRTPSIPIIAPSRFGGPHNHLHPTHAPLGQTRPADFRPRNPSLNGPTASEVNGDENGVRATTPDASATNLSQPADPELEPEQTQQNDDDMSSSSHTLSADGGLWPSSQEGTPRPSSHNELVERPVGSTPEPTRLAQFLRNIAPDGPSAGSSTLEL